MLLSQGLRYIASQSLSVFNSAGRRYLPTVATGVQSSSNHENGNSGSKNEKQSGSWSGKNAWKVGALSIAASAAFAAGCGIAVWGMSSSRSYLF